MSLVSRGGLPMPTLLVMTGSGHGRQWVRGAFAIGSAAAVTVLALSGTAGAAARSATALASYSDGDVVAGYQVVFAGYGQVLHRTTSTGPEFTLQPRAPSQPAETHSALVVSQRSFAAAARYSVRVTTQAQLRTGSSPNPWESGWVVFNYTDPDHFYYLALKTNGWELGKRDPAYPGGQRFLATGSTPAAVVGRPNVVGVRTNGGTLQIRVDGAVVARFTDTQAPYKGGRFGFYSEDARVRFDRITTP